MSRVAVELFYRELELDPELRAEALSFQRKFTRQEEIIDHFIELAGGRGFEFNAEELIEYIFIHGKEGK